MSFSEFEKQNCALRIIYSFMMMMMVIMTFLLESKKEKKRNSLESYGVSAEQHLIVTKHSWLRQSRERLQNNWTTKVRDFRDRKDLLESTPLWVNTVDLGLRSRRVYEQ